MTAGRCMRQVRRRVRRGHRPRACGGGRHRQPSEGGREGTVRHRALERGFAVGHTHSGAQNGQRLDAMHAADGGPEERAFIGPIRPLKGPTMSITRTYPWREGRNGPTVGPQRSDATASYTPMNLRAMTIRKAPNILLSVTRSTASVVLAPRTAVRAPERPMAMPAWTSGTP